MIKISTKKLNLNSIYISERLQESLRPISRCALTTVVAPMGYGKTTAVNWYLEEREKSGGTRIVRISVYSDNLAIFWKSVQEAFSHAQIGFLADYPCPVDSAGGSMLADDLCHELAGDEYYIFIDDFHLLTDGRAANFICVLANRLPTNVHLIVAGRDRFLPADQTLRLGGRLCTIGTDQLRLNHTELAIYARKCGVAISDSQIESLLYSSEGWFSAVYLNLLTLSERGRLPDGDSDIYAMFTAAMIDVLPENQRTFLAVMGIADEFSAEMARFVTGNPDAEELIASLTSRNAFVKRLPDGVTFRFHHMMKECAARAFLSLEPEKQVKFHENYGAWYEKNRQYIHAMAAYRKSGNFDLLLRVVEKDTGILLSSLRPDDVLEALSDCPTGILKTHPTAILVLMRCMFNWRLIQKMNELESLLIESINDTPGLSDRERGDLLGERDLIMSFLCYNDISAMSRLHRSASERMTRQAISIKKSGGWTFGSPSVLMMFYRAPGELESELAEMDECMPHYYKITDRHGQGAEKLMRAEADFCRGRFTDAQIGLESAYTAVDGNGQENMSLCCDFLAWRLSLCADVKPRSDFENRRAGLQKYHNSSLLNILDATSAYFHALTGELTAIPELFSEHKFSSINILAPGKPMYSMIENQVSLAKGEFARVIGQSEGQLAICRAMNYALVALHVKLQTAAAYEMLGKRSEARGLVESAISDATPDFLITPFAENYRYLSEILSGYAENNEFVSRIISVGEEIITVANKKSTPDIFEKLTERERGIVSLMSGRLTNREIAEKLFLSEGSVKQYMNQIYSKLGIEGDTRTKRARLLEICKK